MNDSADEGRDAAFEAWLNSSPVRKPSYLSCWLAAREAQRQDDLEAIEKVCPLAHSSALPNMACTECVIVETCDKIEARNTSVPARNEDAE